MSLNGSAPDPFDRIEPEPGAGAIRANALNAAPAMAAAEARKPFKLSAPVQLRDPTKIPPRNWLYDKRLISSFVALTVSPGGVGKSSLTLTEAVAMATGKPLLGAAPTRPLRVWIWSGEDPVDEVERRLAAICLHYGITANDLGDRLSVDTGRRLPIKLVTAERGGVIVDRPLIEEFVQELKSRDIDVLILDPFVTLHSVEENANSAINTVVSIIREIADRTGCAIELVHHSAKAAAANSSEAGISQSRGASALVDGVRSARYIAQMTPAEAEKAGIEAEKRRRFFQVVDGKANLAPPVEKAVWREMISVALGNGSELYPDGDFVGVPVEWKMPDAFEGVTLHDLKAVQDGLGSGEWRYANQSDSWAGFLVAEVLGIDAGRGLKKNERSASHAKARAKISTLLKQWENSGAIIKDIRPDETRRDRPFYATGDPVTAEDFNRCSSQSNWSKSTGATGASNGAPVSPPPLGGVTGAAVTSGQYPTGANEREVTL